MYSIDLLSFNGLVKNASCSEVEERVDNFASGLEEEKLTPPNPDGLKLLALYSRNRPEWVIAEQVSPHFIRRIGSYRKNCCRCFCITLVCWGGGVIYRRYINAICVIF